MDEWIKKAVVHLHSGVLHGRRKSINSSFVTAWRDLENIMLNETRQSKKDKYHIISLICAI